MATKTNLITAINNQLTAIITQAKVRLAASLVVDELYPALIQDNQLTNNLLTASGNVDYSLRIYKQGSIVYMSGFIINNSASILDSVNIATIDNSEYNSEVGCTFYGNENANIRIFSDTLSILGSIGVGQTIYVNINYKAID